MKPDNRSLNTSPTTATCTICEESSKELQAKYNTTDMIDILYAEATK